MLNLIYHFQASQNQNNEWKPASYHVIYFFDNNGFLDQKMLQELSKSIENADHIHLTFLNLDDLKAFAMRVAQELKASNVRLLSVQDYNIGIDGSKDRASYLEMFQKFGELIANEELNKPKGFFGKLFS